MFSYGILFLATCALASAYRPLLDGRIVNGRPADIKEFPHQISLQFNSAHICGGSIISKNYILTAAHCMVSTRPDNFAIRSGSTDRYRGGYLNKVEQIFVHPDYDKSNNNNDFAIMRIKGEFQLGQPGVSAAKLTTSEPPTGLECTVSGWGRIQSGGASPDELRAVNVHVFDRKACGTAYVKYGGITDKMFCAADPGKDSCQGDSGGPLICNNILSGVVSWGVGCADARYPGVYSNIAKVKNWIYDVANVM